MRFSRLVLQTIAVVAVGTAILDQYGGRSSIVVRAEDEEPIATTKVEETKEDAPYVPPQNAEKYNFEAEVHRMLDIVINSLYQNNDIFLRELISNASDALDKIRYLLLTDPDTYKTKDAAAADIPLEVKIEYDETAHTLTIRDSGVGMTHDELVQNLGTVARSGTTKFMEALKESGGNKEETISQIGQFGVGFYSTFLVADRVSVASKSPKDDTQHVWESMNGSSEFVIYPDPRGNTLGRGTEITLHLKDDAREYTKPYKLKELAKHYSEFVTYPISLRTTEVTQVEEEDEDDEFDEEKKKETKDGDDELDIGDDEDTAEKPKKMKEVTSYSWDIVNGNQAIWTREKENVTADEYQAFYHVLTSNELENATEWTHFNAEGNINFKSILYLPEEIPANYKYGNMDKIEGAIRLYVRRVLIGDSFDLLPKYLGFIRGVIDSDDLPLNVNRETLQESKILKVIQKKIVRKAIDMIRQFAKESDEASATEKKEEDSEATDDDEDKVSKPNKYLEWYKKFSQNIKMGILDDYGNQAKLVKLLRYVTSKSNGTYISVDDYINNMKDWQKDVYVLGCSDVDSCKKSPFLQTFKEKDVEVIYMIDAIDEYMVKNIREFEKKKIVQISSENVKLNDEDEDLIKRREKVYAEKFKPLTKWLKSLYHGTVLRIQVAKRPLGSVPAIVTSSEYGNSANMERILKAQAYQQGVDASSIMAMKVFEINPRHPLIIKLLEGCPPEKDDDFVVAPETIDAAWMLHDIAMTSGGFPLHDTVAHNKRMLKVLKSQLKIDSLELEPEINPPIEVDEPADEGNADINLDDLGLEYEQMEGAGIETDEL